MRGRFGEFALVHAAPHAVVSLVGRIRAAEHTGDGVVVGLREGIKLVIVAAHAAERQAEKSGADFADLLINVILHLELVHRDDFDIAKNEKARGGDVCGSFLQRCGRQEVSGNLFADEMIEGFVGVEGIDDVVAITPRMLGKDVV